MPASAREHKPYAILLCKAVDVSTEPSPPGYGGFTDYINELFLKDGQGTGNIYDYFLNMSYGSIDLDGSHISPRWYTMTTPKAELDKRNNGAPVNRGQTLIDCRNAAAASADKGTWGDFSGFAGVVTIINIPTDSGQAGAGVVVGWPTDLGGTRTSSPAFIEHEMGHALGLDHSMTMKADTTSVHTWSPGGDSEYGDCWDIMSALGCTFGYLASPYGRSGPELEAAYRDKLGWMPRDRIYTYAGTGKQTIHLAAVNAPRRSDYLLAKIPISGRGLYTLEYRHPSDWDRAIPHDAVLIHEWRASTISGEEGSVRTFLVARSNSSAWLPGQVFQDTVDKVRVSIDAVSGASAQVTIGDDVSTAPGPGTGGDLNCDPHCTPTITVNMPSAPEVRGDGKPIGFDATVDNPAGTLSDSSIVWTANGAPLGTGPRLTATLTAGKYQITVTATNSLDAQAAKTVPLVACDDTLCTPDVSITAPASHAHVYAGVSFTLAGTAQDAAGDIADENVAWFANGARLGLGRTLTTSIATPGTYAITMSATNPLGYRGNAFSTLIVDPLPPGPTVSITSPVDGTLYTDVTSAGQRVTLQADGSSGVNHFNWSDAIPPDPTQKSLGSGQTLTVTLLPTSTTNCALTTHVITLTGTRDDRQKASAQVTVTLRATCIR